LSQSPFLLDLAAMVRAGAVDHAWSLFTGAGLAASDDPAVLTLKGRILKDRARAAQGAARAELYGQAAAAYLAAAPRGGGAYALINAATLSPASSDRAAARIHALAVLDAADDDTPYYQAATRAEALLVLGRFDEARAALEAAVAVAPKAWEDHAVTLRQFRLLLATLDQDDGWLAVLAPPRALYFAGHMAVSSDDEALAGQVARLVSEERVAFGYGALAAGADILVAEALSAAGVELHVLLPASPAVFRARSVVPWGEAWGPRFDRLIAQADSVRVTARDATDVGPPAIALAAETAMGLAVLKAATLAGEAVRLLVQDQAEPGAPASTWTQAGRRQRVLTAPRRTAAPGRSVDSAARLAAFLGCALDLPADADPGDLLRDLAAAIQAGPAPLTAASWSGRTLLLVYEAPVDAARAAQAIRARLGAGVRLAAGHGLAVMAPDPFGDGQLATGAEAEAVVGLLAATPPGAIHLGVAFAAALSLAGPADLAQRLVDLTGDELGPYALRA
jgi:tetratricopeptide (TPR) repeat protein